MNDLQKHEFRDQKNRKWSIVIHGQNNADVFDTFGVDFFDYPDVRSPLHERIGKPSQMVPILWILLEEQADAAGIGTKDFGEAMFGDALIRAQEALAYAALNFIPTNSRGVLKQLIESGEAARDKVTEKLKEIEENQMVSKLTDAAVKEFNQSLDAALEDCLKAIGQETPAAG